MCCTKFHQSQCHLVQNISGWRRILCCREAITEKLLPKWYELHISYTFFKQKIHLAFLSLCMLLLLCSEDSNLAASSSDSTWSLIHVVKRQYLLTLISTKRCRVINPPASYSGVLGSEIGYPDWGFPWFSSVPPGEYLDITLKLGHMHFFSSLFQVTVHLSLFHSMLCSLQLLKKGRGINYRLINK
jgi:hypothetical protein